jgi:hypothetical protein
LITVLLNPRETLIRREITCSHYRKTAIEIVTPFTPLSVEKEGGLETQWVAVFRFNPVNADVVYYQTQPIFPSWTSRVRSLAQPRTVAGQTATLLPTDKVLIRAVSSKHMLSEDPYQHRERRCVLFSIYVQLSKPELKLSSSCRTTHNFGTFPLRLFIAAVTLGRLCGYSPLLRI